MMEYKPVEALKNGAYDIDILQLSIIHRRA